MPYRAADRQRALEAAHEAARKQQGARRERIAWVASEIQRLDWLIGEWATRLPNGASAPPQVVALMVEKEGLVLELRELAALEG